MEKEEFDNIEIYCRKLGHYVPFRYCRTSAGGMPCRGIFDCTFEKLPVKEFIAEHYSDDEVEAFMTPPAQKLSTILDLIQEAKKHKK